MASKNTPSQQELAEARKAYDEGRMSLAEIADQLGLSTHRFRQLRKQQSWPPRSQNSVAQKNKVLGATHEEIEPAKNARQLARRLETTVRQQLENVATRLRTDGSEGAERNARILASLVKSLVELRRLETHKTGEGDQSNTAHSGGANEQPPRSLAELREELAAHLARMQPARNSRAGDKEF